MAVAAFAPVGAVVGRRGPADDVAERGELLHDDVEPAGYARVGVVVGEVVPVLSDRVGGVVQNVADHVMIYSFVMMG